MIIYSLSIYLSELIQTVLHHVSALLYYLFLLMYVIIVLQRSSSYCITNLTMLFTSMWFLIGLLPAPPGTPDDPPAGTLLTSIDHYNVTILYDMINMRCVYHFTQTSWNHHWSWSYNLSWYIDIVYTFFQPLLQNVTLASQMKIMTAVMEPKFASTTRYQL